MSLHATTTPDAQAKLDAQRRNSTISSFIIAVLFCALIVAILFYIALKPLLKNEEPMVTYNDVAQTTDKPTRPEHKNEVQKKPARPSTNASRALTTMTQTAVSIPVSMTNMTEPSLDFGLDNDFGEGSNIGNGIDGGNGIPDFKRKDISKRCSKQDRIERLTKEGGKEDYEDQVVIALRWLQKNQAADGSWKAQGKPVAMTGLALLAYLGHCETPASVEFGETVQNAILYLIQVGEKNGGALATSTANKQWCYEHAIATYALAEAYSLCKEFKLIMPKLEETVLAAGNLLIGNQNENGGWAYNYSVSGGHTDSSVTCWQLQALKACKITKLEFNGLKKCATNGIKYLESCKNGKGTIGYTPGSQTTTMTPGAALCYQQWGKGKRSQTRNAVKWINETNEFNYKTHANLYMHYYASQTMINARGKAWMDYNKKTMAHLAESQNTDGSWSVPAGASHGMSSKHYATCLSVLMMEVYYRFLPSSD